MSATPASPVNWSTTSSATLWASRRVCAAGSSIFLAPISRNSGEVRSCSRISISARSPRRVSTPCRPAWAPADAKLAKAALSAAGSPTGIAGTSETTLNRLENVRSRAVTRERLFPRPWVSGPPTTVKCGITMLSFLAPVASTLSSTSAACERAAGGEESAPPSAASSTSPTRKPSGRPGRISLFMAHPFMCQPRRRSKVNRMRSDGFVQSSGSFGKGPAAMTARRAALS